jgi:hypothetical protein
VAAFEIPNAAGNDRAGGHNDDSPLYPMIAPIFCHTIAIRPLLPFQTAPAPDKLRDFAQLSMLSSARTFGLSRARRGLELSRA